VHARRCHPEPAPASRSRGPKPDATWGELIRQTVATLPRALPEWAVVTSRTAKTVTLAVKPTGSPSHVPTDLHFFAADNLVGYELPQEVKSDGKGGFVLSLQVAPDAPADAKNLTGISTARKRLAGRRKSARPRGQCRLHRPRRRYHHNSGPRPH
jgi:hypothetical protein